jgi:hypothetical protein
VDHNIQEQRENRVLFVTNDGRLGFASSRILEGDLVCMLYAGRLLYTMRLRDTQESPTVSVDNSIKIRLVILLFTLLTVLFQFVSN